MSCHYLKLAKLGSLPLAVLFLGGLFFTGVFLYPAQVMADTEIAQDNANVRDDRLPPVLPGEEVNVSNGRKMKVWSTSGSPTQQPTPTAGSGINNENRNDFIDGQDISVIVDDRNHKRPHRKY